MITDAVRPLNERERDAITKMRDRHNPPGVAVHSLRWIMLWMIVLASSTTPFFFLRREVESALWLGTICGIALVLGVVSAFAVINLGGGFFRTLRAREASRVEKEQLLRLLDSSGGQIWARSVSASDVIAIDTVEDEGSGYLYDVHDGKVLFLKGDYYVPTLDQDEWPNTQFDIVRTTDGSVWIGVFCYGEALRPRRVLSGHDLQSQFVWEPREDVVEGSLNDVAESLRRVG